MEIDEIIGKMSLRQKADLLTGKDFWQTRDYPELGVPSIFLSDGPHGLRKQAAAADHLGLNASIPATCFPTAATIANSWDEELGETVGTALGEEAASLKVNVLLGPGTNIKRNPRCGRNFEYFSEDPYLAGKIAASYIRGIQANGTSACVKHFALNNQEERRMVSDSVVDERTMREIYLTAFEIAVKEGKTKSVMTSYNRINGVHADENMHTLRDILRGEWGYTGAVISDWAGTNNKVNSTRAGSNLEMPSCRYGADDIVKAVEGGELEMEYVDESVRRVLELVFSTSAGEKGVPFDVEAHHALARRAAQSSIVLLKNDGVLPIKPQTKVAIIGDFAKTPRYQGAGSSVVNPTKLDNAIDIAGKYLDGYVGYAKGFKRYGANSNGLIKKAVKLAQKSDVALLFLGLDEISEAEGLDREHIRLPQNQLDLFNAVVATGKKVVVVLSCGSSVELEPLRQSAAIVYGCLAGQAGAECMLEVINGTVNPCGKLAETFPVKYEDCASASHFPGKVMTVEYREGPFVGYRYFDTAGVDAEYPFGYGLSYTKFEYSDLTVDGDGVSFTLSNVGETDGAEIAQLYVGKSESAIFRPKKELKGFKKTFVKAGESVRVTIPFDDKTFRYFNVATNKWEIEGGKYELYVAASVADVRLTGEIEQVGTTDVVPYDKAVMPTYYGGAGVNVPDAEFAALLGRDIPSPEYKFYKKNRMVIDENCTVSDLRYSRKWLGRAFSGLIRFAIAFLRGVGARTLANTLVMGVLHQPVRGLAKFGGMNRKKMEGLLRLFNGKMKKSNATTQEVKK